MPFSEHQLMCCFQPLESHSQHLYSEGNIIADLQDNKLWRDILCACRSAIFGEEKETLFSRDAPIAIFGADTDHRSTGISICRYRYSRSQRQIHKFFYLLCYCSSIYIFNDSSYKTLTLYIKYKH